jgi:hypothetical protein
MKYRYIDRIVYNLNKARITYVIGVLNEGISII